jgi:hypothetical protein
MAYTIIKHVGGRTQRQTTVTGVLGALLVGVERPGTPFLLGLAVAGGRVATRV